MLVIEAEDLIFHFFQMGFIFMFLQSSETRDFPRFSGIFGPEIRESRI